MRVKRISAVYICICMIVSLLSVALLSGCSDKKNKYSLYYLDIKKTSLVTVSYESDEKDTDDLIVDMISKLSTDPKSTDYLKTIPASVSLRDYKLQDGDLALYFSYQYYDISSVEEVLVRAAIVKTLLQIDGVDTVTFYVADAPLTETSGNVVGAMTSSNFLDYFVDESENLEKTTLTLYYASLDGNGLVKEEREVYYDKSMTFEKLVLDYLQKSPESKEAKSPFAKGVKVKSINVSYGVCYIEFDSTILSQMSDVSAQVIIYSIVNSLVELDNISKVSIKVDTSAFDVVGVAGSIDGVYQKNMDLVM